MAKVTGTILLLLSALGASTGAAWAEAPDSDYSTQETRALMHAYAKCVVKRQGRKASEALLANADNVTILRDYPMLISEDCLSREVMTTTQMRFGGDLYRYALADALVNREFAGQEMPDLSAVPRLVHREAGEEPQRLRADGKRMSKRKYEAVLKAYRDWSAFSFLSKYGECVVRVDPRGGRALLLSVPDSPDEKAGFRALQPALTRCLAEGHTLKFGRVALRGSIAINYYRLVHAARRAAPGTSG